MPLTFMTTLLEAHHVAKVFGGGIFDRSATVALEDFSLAIDGDRPSITAVVGESGSGKTTLARLLLGLVTPTRGKVLYQGRDLQTMSPADWRSFRRDVQVIFQDPYEVYNPFYRVDHVLTTPVAKFKLAGNKAEARALIEDVLKAVGLRPEETLGRFPHQLSGGQRQRVMVARALLLRPRLILADEPVSMVDASLRASILGALRQMNVERGISIIYITHDLATAYQISENIVVLYRGSVAEVGDVELVVKQPQHPYTQLLISSIPVASAERTWTACTTAGPAIYAAGSTGCKFADRCPSATSPCLQAGPPLFQTDRHRAVSCYLYQSAPALSQEDMVSVFVTQTSAAGSVGVS
ncbi:MAG TPA: ABC transporter ATP-binding protein, partial [Candidatus Methylomirabilis sp.]|nr:ABC transporter ATP-binding protein [Candidatus Methylomirabilis sp.]